MSPKIETLPVEEIRLKNGATLLFNQVEGAPRIALSIFIPGGNLMDPVPGLSDLVDRLLMKGTQKRSQEQLAVDIDGLTLEVDTDTKRDYSLIGATLLEEDLAPSFEIINDIFFNSTLAEFDREKEKIAGEIQMDLDSPRSRASDQFVRTLFAGTPYSSVSSAILENLPRLNSVDDARKHYRHFYRPDRLIISAAGDIPRERLVKAVEEYLPGSPHDANPVDDFIYGESIHGKRLHEDQVVTFPRDDSNQAHIFKAWLAPELVHEDYSPLVVLNTILGGAGLSSRMFVELRDKQGLAYNVRSSYDSFKYKGMFYLYIGTEPSNKEKCLKGFIEECGKLMNDRVPDWELAEAKQNILGRRTVFLETAPHQASYVGTHYALGRSLKDIETLAERIRAVTAEDIQRVAQQYLSQPSVTSIVAPSSVL